MMQDKYRFTEDKLRQSQPIISDNDKESNMHLGELQETISQLRRGDVTALDNHNSYMRQEATTIALIKTEAKAETDLLRTQIASEGQSGHQEAVVLKGQYESHMNQIRAVMKT